MSHERELARLEAENAALREALKSIARQTQAGSRTFDEIIRAMDYVCDLARGAIASAPTSADDGEGWVRCSERMPEPEQTVEIRGATFADGARAKYRRDPDRWVDGYTVWHRDRVTAWRPTTGGEGVG